MLHRTTWYAIPIIGLVLLGSGLGWWGYDQYQARQTLANDIENQYSGNFHALVDNIQHLHRELGKAEISTDRTGFQKRLRDIWRLSYAAQVEVGRLPLSLMPMHHTQEFLQNISRLTNTWLDTGADPQASSVERQLDKWYADCDKISRSLASLQDKAFAGQIRWVEVNRALARDERDNQVVDGFRKLDDAATAFVESAQHPSSLHRGKTRALTEQGNVDAAAAKRVVQRWWPVTDPGQLHVEQTKQEPIEYVVSGKTTYGDFTATVSRDGGHVLSFAVHYSPHSGDYDFDAAEGTAKRWLKRHGFPDVETLQASQYDGIGYFLVAPNYNGSTVVSQSIAVKVALDKQIVVGLDANNYYYYPVTSVPPRRYTAGQLRARLNPRFHIGMERNVLALDDQGHYQPAVAFYGTSDHDETYCIYMNANTGQEMNVELLS